jgi:DNA-binding LacI/PurR family transcriptional regulator
VTTGRIPEDDETGWWVDNDHPAGTKAVLDHLERAGARRVALITGPPFTSYLGDSITGYESWCESRGVRPVIVAPRGDLAEEAGFQAAGALLDADDAPDAIYATVDRMALGVLRAAETRGIAVPDDLLVAGSTNSDAARWSRPSLTALHFHPDEIGRHAMEMLIGLIEGPPPSPHVLVPTRVIPRASTKRRATS